MALLFADGFEHYGTGSTGNLNMRTGGAYAYVYSSSNVSPSDTRSRTGLYSFRPLARYTDVLRKHIPSTHNEIGVAFGWYLDSLPSSELSRHEIRFGTTDGTRVCRIDTTPTGALAIRTGESNTLIFTTDDGILSPGAWYHIEIRILRDNVVGEIEIRVNGTVEAFLNNLDLGTDDVRLVSWNNPKSGTPYWSMDDLIIWDTTGTTNNTFFGPARVNTIFPASDTAQADFAVTGATSGYDAINDAGTLGPDGDTTYIGASTIGAKSDFGLDTLPSEVDSIAGVYVPAMAKLSAAGLGNFKISIVSNSQVADGPDTILTTAYTYWGAVFETNPDGDVPWNKATLEAALVRLEKTA